MRGLGRFFWGPLVFVAAAAAILLLFRGPIARAALRGAMEKAGIENPGLKVRKIGFDGISLEDVTGGADPAAPALSIDRLDVAYDFGALLRSRTVESIALGPGSVRIEFGKDGSASLAGLKLNGGERPAQAMPFRAVAFNALDIEFVGPQGEARARINGAIDLEKGGALKLAATSRALAMNGLTIENSRLDGALTLADTGAGAFDAAWTGDLASAAFGFRGIDLRFEGEGQSWRQVIAGGQGGLTGRAQVGFKSAAAAAADNAPLASLFSLLPAPAARSFKIDGAVEVEVRDGRIAASLGDGGAVRIQSDRGDALSITALTTGAALYSRSGGEEKFAAKAVLGELGSVGSAAFTAARTGPQRPWKYTASGDFGDQSLRAATLGPTRFSAKGATDGKSVNGTADIATLVRQATIGRLTVIDAPVAARIRLNADLVARTLVVSSQADNCVRMSRARLTLAGQDSDARLSAASLCRDDGPLIAATWGDVPGAVVKGRLSAKSGSYRLGMTRFEGAPPIVDLTADYDPKAQLTNVAGAMRNGRIVINGAIVAASAEGTFQARLDKADLSGTVQLARVTLTQNVDSPQIAPIVATGAARLAEERIDFNYAAATEGNIKIGQGEGAHDVRAGVGRTTFRSGELTFAPRGLQPAQIISALKGIVGAATGKASGEATFVWGRRRSDFKSSGALALQDLTFRGPGRAVSKTVGVNGDMKLASLSPLKSEGEHTVTVALVDLDALQLENGVIRFSLPGDGTMRVISGAFPWFGGRIGAYESIAALTGAKIETALRAENVDLGEMLAFLKVEGLSGEGVVEGTLPLAIEEGKARIVDGFMTAKGPGAIRYVGKAVEAASASNAQAKLAFDILRDLRFDELTAKVNGPLDGDLTFNVVFKGVNEVTVDNRRVPSPVIYRISLEAPILALIDQARVSTDIKLQLERAEGGTSQ